MELPDRCRFFDSLKVIIIPYRRTSFVCLLAPLQGSWIGEADTEGFVSLRSK